MAKAPGQKAGRSEPTGGPEALEEAKPARNLQKLLPTLAYGQRREEVEGLNMPKKQKIDYKRGSAAHPVIRRTCRAFPRHKLMDNRCHNCELRRLLSSPDIVEALAASSLTRSAGVSSQPP